MTDKIPKSIAKSIITSFSQGVVPSKGLGKVAVGRKEEIESVDDNLSDLVNGQGTFRLIVGRYGAGKSFMLSLIREHAMNRGMVVMKADLSEGALFSGSKKGIGLYRALVSGMSTNGKQGGAMETILKRWVETIRDNVSKIKGIPSVNVSVNDVLLEIKRQTYGMSSLPLYSVFIQMVGRYYTEMMSGGVEQNALMWLKGEYEQRSLAKKELDVGTIVDDNNWFDFIMVWSEFVRHAGYKGLVLMFDEVHTIYKLNSSRVREKNYERILSIYNHIVQSPDTHMAVYMGCTPDSLDNDRRGFRSCEALYSRVSHDRYINGRINPFGVVLNLRTLSKAEVVLLLSRLRDFHAQAYEYESRVTDEMVYAYANKMWNSNAIDAVTPRNLSSEFIPVLNVLYMDSNARFEDLVEGIRLSPDRGHDDDIIQTRMDLEI